MLIFFLKKDRLCNANKCLFLKKIAHKNTFALFLFRTNLSVKYFISIVIIITETIEIKTRMILRK